MSNNMDQQPKHPLRSIYFYPTESCNLKCIHCWIRPAYAPDEQSYQRQNQENVSVEVMDQVVRDALPLGLSHVKFTGGEPFFHPRLFEFIDCFSGHGLSLSFETNGTLLSAGMVQRLCKHNVTQISVSLDGSHADIHERIRGVGRSFEKAVNGIQLLMEHQIDPQVIFCLQKINAHDLENTIRLAEKMKVKLFEINPMIFVGTKESSQNGCEGLSLEELLDLENKVETEYANRYPNMHIDLYLPPALKGIRELARHPICTCAIFNICGILSNGDVSICGIGSRNRELVMGNVKEKSVSKIWEEGILFKEIREQVPLQLKGVCRRCLFKHHCLGFCRAEVISHDKTVFNSYPVCEEACRKGLFPESRLLEESELSRTHEKWNS